MKAQCCICSDLFDQDGGAISAVACGHTFHEECLMKWLDTSHTCPHCRKRINRNHIVRKLYFDRAEDYDEGNRNPDQLINEVDQLRVDLRRNQKELDDSKAAKSLLAQNMEDLRAEKKTVEKQLKKEQTSSSCYRKQLLFYESQQNSLDTEREEYKSAKRKLVEMKDIESLLNGCDSDAQDIIHQHSDGEGSVRQLATYCAVLKREYEKNKNEKKVLKDDLERRRKELLFKERALSDKTKKVTTLSEQFKHSENELKYVEKEREILKQKIRRLKRAVVSSNPEMTSSFIEACKEQTVMPTTPASLQKPKDDTKFIDFSDDFDAENAPTAMALTPEVVRPSPTTTMKRQCEENLVQFVKISSACDNPPSKRVKTETKIQDVSNFAAMGSMNIFRKKTGPDYSGSVRRGFNGLGGYTTATQSTSFGKFLPKKPSSKPRNNIGPLGRMSKKKDLPDFPKLSSFLEID